MSGSALTVRQVAARYGVANHSVLAWIRNGELRALDVSRRPGGRRPTWRITLESLRAFEVSRTPLSPAPVARRKRREEIAYY